MKEQKTKTWEDRVKDFFKEREIRITSTNLLEIQREMFKLGIRPLVGLRTMVGAFTADTYIYIPEKSNAGKPHFERIFSPFSYNGYNDALKVSISQVLDYYDMGETH